MKGTLWTQPMIERAKKMRAQGFYFCDIDEALGLRDGAAQKKFRSLRASNPDDIAVQQGYKQRGPYITKASYVPPAVIAERDHRLALERDLTGAFMGDPLPGYSALDRRRA